MMKIYALASPCPELFSYMSPPLRPPPKNEPIPKAKGNYSNQNHRQAPPRITHKKKLLPFGLRTPNVSCCLVDLTFFNWTGLERSSCSEPPTLKCHDHDHHHHNHHHDHHDHHHHHHHDMKMELYLVNYHNVHAEK
jgi:hypothetical protein